MRKNQTLINKLVYFGLSTLDLSKTVMYEFWYNYVKPKYGENSKFCYVDTDFHFSYITEDVETRFDISNVKIDRPLPKGNYKNVMGLMKYGLDGQFMKQFVDSNKDKKAKGTNKSVIKRKHKFQYYKNCLEAAQIKKKMNHLEKNNMDVDSLKDFIKSNKLILKAQERLKSERHNIVTEENDKFSLSLIDDKRIQSICLIETYAYGTSTDPVSEKEEIKCNNIIKRYKK